MTTGGAVKQEDGEGCKNETAAKRYFSRGRKA